MIYRIPMSEGITGKKKQEGLKKKKPQSVAAKKKSKDVERVDEKFWRMAIENARRQPRLALYSPIASAVLNYWKNVIPRFSISDLLAKMVEREIASRWPQLYIKAKKSLGVRKGRRET